MKNSKTENQGARTSFFPWVTPKEWIQAVCMLGLLVLIFQPVLQFLRPSADPDLMAIRSLKDLGLATHLYSEDWDDKYPLSHGDSGGTHLSGWLHIKYVPADWPVTSSPTDRVSYSRSFILNTITPYGLFENPKIRYPLGPPLGQLAEYQPTQAVRSNRRKITTGYSYNGLLHGYEAAAVVAPVDLPLFTALNGNALLRGGGIANPLLNCTSWSYNRCVYRPRGASCDSSAGGAGGTSTVYPAFGSATQYTSNHGQHWLYVDGHVAFRRLGDLLEDGYTDYRVDPFSTYDEAGVALYFWTDGCHPLLFRPDYDFTD